MSAYINIAVSLILVYLIVSLVVTACNEIVSTVLKTRPRMLVQTIVEIIGNDDLLQRFYRNGIITAARGSSTAGKEAWKPAGLRERLFGHWMEPRSPYERGHPSYIEGKNFAKALGMAVMGWNLDRAKAACGADAAVAAAKAAAGGADADKAADAAIAAAAVVRAFDPTQEAACDDIVKAAGQAKAQKDLVEARKQATAAAALTIAAANIADAAIATAGTVKAMVADDPAQAKACDRIIADAGTAKEDDILADAKAQAKAASDLAGAVAGGVPTLDGIAKAVGDLPDGALKDVLRSALTGVKDDLGAFEKAVSAWYDTTQDRLSGAYARYQKYLALAFGAILACMLNVDSVQITHRLSLDHPLAQRIADEAVAYAQEGIDSACKEGTDDRAQCLINEASARLAKIDPLLLKWADDPVVVGFKPADGASWTQTVLAVPWLLWLYKILGLLLTTLAVSLGAPFWFDTLSMFVNVRGAGAKPADGPEGQPAAKAGAK